MKLVTIIPPDPKGCGPVLTQGTRVQLEDGTEIKGITKLVLHADVGDIWRAEIHCHVRPQVMRNMLGVVHRTKLTWWQRVCLRMAGCKELDRTALGDTSIKHVANDWFEAHMPPFRNPAVRVGDEDR